MDKELVGKKLKFVREKNNLTMDELKDEFNKKYGSSVSKSMISNWENGRYLISNKNLNLYVDYFEIPISFFTLDDRKNNDLERMKMANEWAHGLLSNPSFSDAVKKAAAYTPNFDDIYNILSHDDIYNNICEYLDLMNLAGLDKVLNYCKDISKIESYILSDTSKE